MNKIYQGESLNFVFRCKNKCGKPVNLENTIVSVLLKDNYDNIVYKFSTLPHGNIKKIKVDKNYVICRLDKSDTSLLSGIYSIEVKITKGNGELVMIAIHKGIRIYDSEIGKEINL